MLQMLFSGHFTHYAAVKVTEHWIWLSVGLGFGLLGNIFAKLWQAQARPKLLSIMAGGSLLTLCMIFFSLKKIMHEQSISIALAFSSAAVVLFGARFLRSRKEPFSKSL